MTFICWTVAIGGGAASSRRCCRARNTVVAKPAPTTPLTTLRFGELCARVLPAGVVNVIVDQNDLGREGLEEFTQATIINVAK